MKRSPWLKRLAVAAVALAVLGTVGFVALRAGPLAPLQVTVATVHEGA